MFSRKAIIYTASGVFGLIIAPVVGELFVEIARQNGLYDNPGGAVSDIVSFISGFTDYSWYPYLVGSAFGTLVGINIDWFLRRREAKPSRSQEVGRRCQKLVEYIKYDLRGLRVQGSTSLAMSEYEMLQRDFDSLGLKIPDMSGDSLEFLRAMVPALERYYPFLLENRLKEIQEKSRKAQNAKGEA